MQTQTHIRTCTLSENAVNIQLYYVVCLPFHYIQVYELCNVHSGKGWCEMKLIAGSIATLDELPDQTCKLIGSELTGGL